jgi:hypothetical protein
MYDKKSGKKKLRSEQDIIIIVLWQCFFAAEVT